MISARDRGRKYEAANREKRAAAARLRRLQNPEAHAAAKRKFLSLESNKQKAREYAAAYRLAHPERVKKWDRERCKVKNAERCRRYKAANPEKVLMYSRRRLSTPNGIMANRVRARLRECLRLGKESKKTTEILGYTVAELRAHLERQFTKGMGWHNTRDWHIDHIVPLASFTITGPDDPELRRAWALTNLRPLLATDNYAKGSKRLTLL